MKYLVLCFLVPMMSFATTVSIELGAVQNPYNKVQIPGDEGTQFNMASSLKDNSYYQRFSFYHVFNKKHGMRLLYAPLEIDGDKTYAENISFQGVSFAGGSKTKTTYRFDSYRATYFYRLIEDESLLFDLGGTLKVRDAEIALKQGETKKSKSNTGLVPLLYLFSEYKWRNGYRLALDFDGLAAPQGRAFDVALMVGRYFGPSLNANLGFRMLEGGVDNDEVYNFSQFNFFFASVAWNF